MANEYRATKANLRALVYNDAAEVKVNLFRVEVWRSVATAPVTGGGAGKRMRIIT